MIGWSLPFSGMWLRDWSILQQSHYDTIGSRRSGKLWLSKLIRRIWQIAWNLWIHRNKALHETDEHRARVTVLASIQAIYRLPRTTLPSQLQRRFIPWEEMSTKPIPFLEAWLKAYQVYKQHYRSSRSYRNRQSRVQRSLGN